MLSVIPVRQKRKRKDKDKYAMDKNVKSSEPVYLILVQIIQKLFYSVRQVQHEQYGRTVLDTLKKGEYPPFGYWCTLVSRLHTARDFAITFFRSAEYGTVHVINLC